MPGGVRHVGAHARGPGGEAGGEPGPPDLPGRALPAGTGLAPGSLQPRPLYRPDAPRERRASPAHVGRGRGDARRAHSRRGRKRPADQRAHRPGPLRALGCLPGRRRRAAGGIRGALRGSPPRGRAHRVRAGRVATLRLRCRAADRLLRRGLPGDLALPGRIRPRLRARDRGDRGGRQGSLRRGHAPPLAHGAQRRRVAADRARRGGGGRARDGRGDRGLGPGCGGTLRGPARGLHARGGRARLRDLGGPDPRARRPLRRRGSERRARPRASGGITATRPRRTWLLWCSTRSPGTWAARCSSRAGPARAPDRTRSSSRRSGG